MPTGRQNEAAHEPAVGRQDEAVYTKRRKTPASPAVSILKLNSVLKELSYAAEIFFLFSSTLEKSFLSPNVSGLGSKRSRHTLISQGSTTPFPYSPNLPAEPAHKRSFQDEGNCIFILPLFYQKREGKKIAACFCPHPQPETSLCLQS